jgi:hypothetical protein
MTMQIMTLDCRMWAMGVGFALGFRRSRRKWIFLFLFGVG